MNTVNLGSLTAFQQAVLCILLIVGNVIFVSTFIVLIRRFYFRKRLAELVQHSQAARKVVEDLERHADEGQQCASSSVLRQRKSRGQRIKGKAKRTDRGGSDTDVQTRVAKKMHRVYYHQSGFGFFPTPWEAEAVRSFFDRLFAQVSGGPEPGEHYYLSFEPQLDAKGRLFGLNERQRLELGGVEYRALQALLYVLVGYQVFWLSLGVLFLVPYAYRQSVTETLHGSQSEKINMGWWGFFNVVTEFSNGGLNLANANFIPFQSFYYLLIISGALSLAGQTQFPILLRLLIWALEKSCPAQSRVRHTLAFLLHHPRRCFIYLFPKKETWYLLAIQLTIDLTAWVLFVVVNIGMPQVMAIPTGTRVIDGLFQATGLRTSGAYIIAMSSLAPALLVAYLVIMYISSFPLIMALRKTNTYEERSIGLDETDSGGSLAQHLMRQLAYDMWFQLLAWFLICIVERGKVNSAQPGFSVFSILFEVTSAYGTVGLSTGVPYDQYSLSGAFDTLSKVIMLLVMIRGRHRGLPLAIDRSILLPGEELMHRIDKEYNEKGKCDPDEAEELEQDIRGSGLRGTGPNRDTEEQDPEHGKAHDYASGDATSNGTVSLV